MKQKIDLITPVPIHLPARGLAWYPAHAQLRPWVQCCWSVTSNSIASNKTEYLYPDGGSSLYFYFSGSELKKIAFDSTQHLRSFSFEPTSTLIGVRFNPGGAFKLLRKDLNELNDAQAIEQLFSLPQQLELTERLLQSTTSDQKIRAIELWLLQLQQMNVAQSDFLSYFLPHWLNSDKNLTELLAREPISRRKLERRFQQEIGLAPQQLKLLQRVKLARHEIMRNPTQTLTAIGHYCGFYDQAHFIRQFQEVTGQTPGQYKSKKMTQKYNS